LAGRRLETYQPKEVARLVAHVPQGTALDFPFTAREVVLMGRSPHLGRFQLEGPADRQVAEQAMRATETLAYSRRFVNTLSGGERQRVLIARALAQEPRMMLLDEPTSSLDIRHQLSLLAMIQRLAHVRGIGVIAALHDLRLAARFCDRILLLSEGHIAADGSPAEVFTPFRLADVFGVEVAVGREPATGALTVVPLRPAS
jgi:iron complex transport system ATP-binding protein